MKRSFIRALWGIYDHQGRRLYKRRTKIDNDIDLLLKCKYNQPFRTYVFGEDNYKYLTEEVGLKDCTMVDKREIVWDIDTQQFRHKLEAFKCGMEDFDEIVFLDWDTMPVKRLPDDFWERLNSKDVIQAILRLYHRKQVPWRQLGEKRKIPCASFVYCRDKQIPNEMIRIWEYDLNKPWSEEFVIAKLTDNMMGQWMGAEEYEKRFEPDFFYLPESQPLINIDVNYYKRKEVCFRHLNKNQVYRYLTSIKKGKKPEWVL